MKIGNGCGGDVSFGDRYSELYDRFYEAKDYEAEVRFVLARLARAIGAERPLSVLDLGCGTGRHAFELVRLGHRVHGVDRSEKMLVHAIERAARLDAETASRISFQAGDIRDADAQKVFDVVLCLFHVICYLHTRDDMLAAFANVRRHAATDTVYLFDFWNGAAVLAEPPTSREKRVETADAEICRTSEIVWDRDRSIVQIDYAIETRTKATGSVRTDSERHTLRYFFTHEIEDWLATAGFEIIDFGEWMTGLPPSDKSFSAYALARLRADVA